MQIPINYDGDMTVLLDRMQVLDTTLGMNSKGYSKLSSIALELASKALSEKTKATVSFETEFNDTSYVNFVVKFSILEDALSDHMHPSRVKDQYFNWVRGFNASVNLKQNGNSVVIVCSIPDISVREKVDQTSLDELIEVLRYSEEDSMINKSKEDLINDIKERSKNIREKNLEIEQLYRYQEQQKQLIEKIQQADKMKTQFLANMSHELRTPLNSIIGFSELLEDGLVGDLSDEQIDVLGDILKSARHLLDLINRILDISKIEAGMMELNYSIVDFNQLSIDVVNQLHPLLDAKRISIVREIPENLMINLDELRTKQILINLFSNAIKFSNDDSSIKLKVAIELEKAIIAVEDKGIGMRETDLDKIFQEFTQVDDSHTRAYQGTGLGLSLVKKLVELHHGEIWVESTFGEGTTFFFTLPLA